MPTLLRHPAAVPALFSRAAEPEPQLRRGPKWRKLARPAAGWASVVLIEVPLVKGGLAVLGLALHP